jgi:hypothetical protein
VPDLVSVELPSERLPFTVSGFELSVDHIWLVPSATGQLIVAAAAPLCEFRPPAPSVSVFAPPIDAGLVESDVKVRPLIE